MTTQDLEDHMSRLEKLIADQQPSTAPERHAAPDGYPAGAAEPDR